MKSPLKCYFDPSHGWGFSVGSGEKRVRMAGFSTDLQASEARKRVFEALRADKVVPTQAELKASVPEYLAETTAQIRPTPAEARQGLPTLREWQRLHLRGG